MQQFTIEECSVIATARMGAPSNHVAGAALVLVSCDISVAALGFSGLAKSRWSEGNRHMLRKEILDSIVDCQREPDYSPEFIPFRETYVQVYHEPVAINNIEVRGGAFSRRIVGHETVQDPQRDVVFSMIYLFNDHFYSWPREENYVEDVIKALKLEF